MRRLSEANDSLDAFAEPGEKDGEKEPVSEAPRSVTPSPRPLVRRRLAQKPTEDTGELMEILKTQIVQDGLRRDEERRQREEDCAFQRERLEVESKRHERFMEMMMLTICQQSSLTSGTYFPHNQSNK